jgi:hypothetical protein
MDPVTLKTQQKGFINCRRTSQSLCTVHPTEANPYAEILSMVRPSFWYMAPSSRDPHDTNSGCDDIEYSVHVRPAPHLRYVPRLAGWTTVTCQRIFGAAASTHARSCRCRAAHAAPAPQANGSKAPSEVTSQCHRTSKLSAQKATCWRHCPELDLHLSSALVGDVPCTHTGGEILPLA